jgi:hypothetical protein
MSQDHTLLPQALEKGSAIVHVRNTVLAAGLLAMGIPLRDDPPFTHLKDKKGNETFTYNFHSTDPDGRFNTSQLVGWWKRDLDFIAAEERKEAANPDYVIHPWARVLTALKNYQELLEGQAINVPWTPFGYMSAHGPMQLLVKEGTRKHEAALRRGLTPL